MVAQNIVRGRIGGVVLQVRRADVEKLPGHDFRGWLDGIKADDVFAISFLEGFIHFVLGVHAERVVEGVDVFSDGFFQDLEVAYHACRIQFFCFEHKFHFACVTVGKFAFVRMHGEHVTIFYFQCFADSEGHGDLVCGSDGSWARMTRRHSTGLWGLQVNRFGRKYGD